MKKHAIIPIFIAHRGCPHKCVFCNQNAITARSGDITPEDARRIIEEYLPTLQNRGLEEIEVSFFGGSFTGIPMEQQKAFLKVAKEYKDAGLVQKIHMSTRPDYIDREILDNLKEYSADVIELGVQSFDPEVLKLSERGHDVETVCKACKLIKEYGFTLGIQLMIGLPGDSYEACMDSVRQTIFIGPSIARLYPTVIITDTELYNMYLRGDYTPFSQEKMLQTVKDMYKALTGAGINVIRVGLKSSALINDGTDSRVAGNSYHPAFRQLLESELAKDEIISQINELGLEDREASIEIHAAPEMMSNAAGHKGVNRKYITEQYPKMRFSFVSDPSETGIRVVRI